jgi:hypothetical protein
MALAHCILGKFLGVGCHCFPPPLPVPTFSARCLHVQQHERPLAVGGGTLCGREMFQQILSRNQIPRNSRDLLHAANLRHGTDGFTSPPKEGVLKISLPLKIRRLRPGLNLWTWVPKASTLPLDHRSRYIYYIWVTKCADDCSLPLWFSDNSVCTSNVTLCHITQQLTSLPRILLITSGERYKLWSYSSSSFIHFPITFRFKTLNTLNSTIPIFSLQSSLKVTHQVSYTHIYKKYWVKMLQFLPYGRSIGSWICLTHKTYTCHTLQCCACRLYIFLSNE